jgi:hypothetical protein
MILSDGSAGREGDNIAALGKGSGNLSSLPVHVRQSEEGAADGGERDSRAVLKAPGSGCALGFEVLVRPEGAKGFVLLPRRWVVEALVLSVQVIEASLKGLAAGTRDGFHTPIIGEARPRAAPPRPRSKDQFELDALTKYRAGK